jgi:parallel beta-helix repeat protein
MPRNPLLGLAVVAAVAAALAIGGPSSSAAGPCDRIASPAPGAAQQLVDDLAPGQTGCLRAGLYEGNVKVTTPGITLTRFGSDKATVRGRFWIAEGADGVTVEGLYLDGTNRGTLPSPSINANGATFRRNDVTNYNHSICFSLGHHDWGRANHTTIEFNRIHHCGRLPATNHDHGIYVTTASNTLIRGNWIYDNADRGIQLYPDAQNTKVVGNVIDGNGQGIIFSGEGGVASSNNLVEGNVIANSKLRNNVESWYPPGNPIGRNNVVRDNCVRGGAYDDGDGGIGDQRGFTVIQAVRTKPAYESRSARDFRVAEGNPCRNVLAAYRATVPGPDGVLRSLRGQRRRTPAVILGAFREQIHRGGRLPMMGRVAGERARRGLHVVVVAHVRGHRRRLARVRVTRAGTFSMRPRVRVAPGVRAVRVRAVVRGVGRSRAIRVRLSAG